MPIDLHLHSTHSDGSLTPAELIAKAKSQGITAVALTDHNTVSGLPDFMEEARKQGVTAIPGIEISTDMNGIELHLVGLFIAPEHYAAIEHMMQEYHRLKEKSNIALLENLNRGGYAITYADVLRQAGTNTPNRAHVAMALHEAGYVTSVKDAFDRLLREKHGYYTPPARLGITDAIRYLRSIRALPVLAHPFLTLSEEALRAALPDLIAAGLVAMEVQHSTFDAAAIAQAKSVADDYGLLYSGGSDFHGKAKPDVYMGVGSRIGAEPNIPDEYCEKLRTWIKTENK